MFKPTSSMRVIAAVFGSALLLAACGDSGDSTAATPAAPVPVAPVVPAAQTIEGTAATGAALAGANVSVTDAAGNDVCVETAIVTSATGAYKCTLQSGKTAPFLVVVVDPSGAHAPLVSLTFATPAAGTPLVVNATPLTTAIVSQFSPGGDAVNLAQTKTLDSATITAAALASTTVKVLAQLAPVLATLGAPAGYDPFATPITAATSSISGNTADKVIELLKFSTVDGVTTVATVDAPAAGVPLAAVTGTAAALPAPTVAVQSLAEAIRLLAPALNNCFKVASAARVTARNTALPASAGGPEVTGVVADCQDIVDAAYLHNGYRSGQAFYGLLNDPAMDGAVFSAPEIMQFIPAATAAERDRAIVNVRFVDKNGTAGNVVTVATRFPGSATALHPTDWTLYGNQQPVDSSIRAFVRRSEQLAPNPGTAPFANASASRYESGFNIFVNKDGPNSTGLRAARVKGPGLPPAGVVLTRPDPSFCTEQTWLSVLRKDGNTDPAVAVPVRSTDNIFRLQRTLGLTGVDATTLRPNPNAGNTNTTAFPNWAHPLDYGLAPTTAGFIDYSALKAGSTYTFEIFYAGETAPRYTLSKTLLTPVTPAVRGGSLRWIDLTAATRRYLDPTDALAAATPTMNLSWTANPLAETILSAGVYTFNAVGAVDQGLVGVTRGATSAAANAPGAALCAAGASFPALTADGTGGRDIQLRYRVLDGNYKDSLTRYN